MRNALPVVVEATATPASSASSTTAVLEAIISIVAVIATTAALVAVPVLAIELPLLLPGVLGLGLGLAVLCVAGDASAGGGLDV
jgi:hypothetical protein